MARKIGIIVNGATGVECTHQHILKSLLKIHEAGGVPIPGGDAIVPDLILVARNETKLAAHAAQLGIPRFTTNLDAALADPYNEIFFDASITGVRPQFVRKAIAAGKAIYVEKPTATTVEEAIALHREAATRGLKNGVVQDKLLYPGIAKLKYLIQTGFFGKILSVRGDFGYWIFDGFHQRCQRSAWNHVKEQGGGMILDMFPHWCYVIRDLFGPIKAVSALATTNIHRRVDHDGSEYGCTADDTAYATFELASGLIVQFNSSWCVRINRRDLLALQVDGTDGSAVAGLTNCEIQSEAQTPRPRWDPDASAPAIDYRAEWAQVPHRAPIENANKQLWEMFLKHVVLDTPFPWSLLEGARSMQLADAALKSSAERRWVNLDPLE